MRAWAEDAAERLSDPGLTIWLDGDQGWRYRRAQSHRAGSLREHAVDWPELGQRTLWQRLGAEADRVGRDGSALASGAEGEALVPYGKALIGLRRQLLDLRRKLFPPGGPARAPTPP